MPPRSPTPRRSSKTPPAVRATLPPDVRMADVATRAGVSTATVSRALRGVEGVSDATRNRILSLAQSLDYVVSPEASGLSGGSTGRVAVLVHDLAAWYCSSVVVGLESELRTAGIDLIVRCVDTPADRIEFFSTLPLRRKVDALIVVAIPLTPEERNRLSDAGITVIAAGTHDPHFPSVAIDDEQAAQQAVNHLLRLGHERIALLNTVAADKRAWQAQRDRENGYRAAMKLAGVPVDERLVISWSGGARGGAEGMDRLLSGERLPTAVFAFSDEVALGALRSMRRSGFAVPQQISIVSIDDHPLAELTDLTTVQQQPDVLGRAAGKVALAALRGEPVVDPGPFPTRLVIRGTTAPPPD